MTLRSYGARPATSLTISRTNAVRLLRWPFDLEILTRGAIGVTFCISVPLVCFFVRCWTLGVLQMCVYVNIDFADDLKIPMTLVSYDPFFFLLALHLRLCLHC